MKKKIVFVHPPVDLYKRYGCFAFAGGIEPPLGLCYLASVARLKGFDPVIIDAQAQGLSLKQTVDLVISHSPSYVGITSTTSTIGVCGYLAALIKSRDPGTRVIIGGPHVSALPMETMRKFSSFDIGVVGEGEATLEDLLSAAERRGGLSDVSGIVFRQGEKVSMTSRRMVIADVDSIPFPDFGLLPDPLKYYRVPLQSRDKFPSFSLVTSRGCRGQCLFCSKSVFGATLRAHSDGYVVEMLRRVRSMGVKNVLFEDDDFFYDKSRLLRLAQRMIDEDLKLNWSCCCRIDSLDQDILDNARKAGCWQIMVGIENGDQCILDAMRKKLDLNMVDDKLMMARKVGLSVKAFFMLGFPGENEDSSGATERLVMRLALDDVSITFFTPFPGSPIYDDINNSGRLSARYEEFNCFQPVFVPAQMSRSSLLGWRNRILIKFYFRPGIFYGYLRRFGGLSLAGILFRGLLQGILGSFKKGGLHEERSLMVTAQDFGLSRGINEGIIKAREEGIVTRVSFVSCGKFFPEAVEYLRNNPEVCCGLHLCLIEEEPVAGAGNVPTLTGADGRRMMRKWPFFLRYVLGRVDLNDVRAEFEAQLRMAKSAGVTISYLDSHCYTHVLPGIFRIVVGLAREHGIPEIVFPRQSWRLLFSEADLRSLPRVFLQIILNFLGWILKTSGMDKGRIPAERRLSGFISSGRLTEKRLIGLLKTLPPGCNEIVAHPGNKDTSAEEYYYWEYSWEKERTALISQGIRRQLSLNNIILQGRDDGI